MTKCKDNSIDMTPWEFYKRKARTLVFKDMTGCYAKTETAIDRMFLEHELHPIRL